MPLWGANGASSANSPTHSSEHYRANSYNQANAFMNTTPGVYVSNQVFGVYGITNTQVTASMFHSLGGNSSHVNPFLTPGWWTSKQGMGPVINLTIVTPGSGYSNNDKFTATSAYTGASTVNTGANVLTNALGAIVGVAGLVTNTSGSLPVLSGGFGNSGGMFINTASITLSITNTTGGAPNGSGGVANVVLGGRAGRWQGECLVSLPSMTSNTNSANNPIFPNI